MNEPQAPAPAAVPPPRTLRQRIDDHPAALFVGIAIAAATATLGIVLPIVQVTQDSRVASVQAELDRYRSEQQLVVDGLRADLDRVRRDGAAALEAARAAAQARIDELERSLSGITRALGDDTGTYDVSDLVVEPRDAASIPDTSLFHPADRFYALDPERATGWTYEVTTELRVGAETYGLTEEQVRAAQPAELIEALTRFPLRVWYYGGDRLVELDDPVSGGHVTLHPRTMAMLQRVSHEDYTEFQLSLFGSVPGAEEIIRAGFARDPAGWVLQDMLLTEVAAAGHLRPRIDSLQKRDDLAYGRMETVLPKVTVEGRDLPEYYWSREFLIVSEGSDLYLVKLFVADDDHRSPDYAAISAWLDALRIVRP